jgi:hypothetical protein
MENFNAVILGVTKKHMAKASMQRHVQEQILNPSICISSIKKSNSHEISLCCSTADDHERKQKAIQGKLFRVQMAAGTVSAHACIAASIRKGQSKRFLFSGSSNAIA